MFAIAHAATCALLSVLTWGGLVAMSDVPPAADRQGWWQAAFVIAILNACVWVGVTRMALNPLLWGAAFFGFNALAGKFILPALKIVRLPEVWRVLIHPLAIAGMNVLLGGALGQI